MSDKGQKFPMLVLKKSEKDTWKPFQFGVSKAKLILEHIEDIKAFVAEHEKPKTSLF